MTAPEPGPGIAKGDAPALTYITTCKGRLTHLQRSLPRVVDQPGVACIVVDYTCPDGVADWVAARYPQVTLVRVAGQAGFNAARARNLGAQAARTPWLGFFDADILWAPDLAQRVLPQLQSGCFYRAQPVTLQTWGSIICHRDDFAVLGGYDEAFTGWGGEDDDLIARLSLRGRTAASFAANLLSEITHGDDARVRFHEIKERRLQHRVNMLYLQAKLDLMRLTGRSPPLDLRQSMAREVHRTVQAATAAGQPSATVTVNLPTAAMQAPLADGELELWQLRRQLVYTADLVSLQPQPR